MNSNNKMATHNTNLNQNLKSTSSLESIPRWHKNFLENKTILQQELEGKNIAFNIPSPSYVLCANSLDSNLTLLENVVKESGADILVALKGYSFWRYFEPIYTKLQGATCSGLYETLLAFDTLITPLLQKQDEIHNIIETLLPFLQKDSKKNKNECFIAKSHTIESNKEKFSNDKKHYNNSKHNKNLEITEQSLKYLSQENKATKEFKEIESKCTVDYKNYEDFNNTQNNIESTLKTHLKHQDIWQKIAKDIPYAFFHPFIKKEVCVFAPAYKDSQLYEILHYATHIIFNSLEQYDRLKSHIDEKNVYLKKLYEMLKTCKKADNLEFKIPDEIPQIEVGLRINPLYSEVTPNIYNPCIPKSRLGIIPNVFHSKIENLAKKYGFVDKFSFFKAHFSGLHFHTHCEQDSSALSRTLPHVTKHFGNYISHCKWINFGGGHHITRNDYNCALLVKIIKDFREKYNDIKVILEPGEAVGWQTGDLIGEVVDIVENDGLVAILDISASCHMPDCLEMPYRPSCYKIAKDSNGMAVIENDLGENKGRYKYRFGGPTCLAGDVIGDYSFNTILQIGDKIAFTDMIHYTIVKNTTFNGVELPSLGIVKDNTFRILKQFDYTYFKERN